MKTLNDILTTQKACILLVGPPGSGKTVLATQFPKPYLLECDNNLKGPAQFIKDNGLSTDLRFDIPHLDAEGKMLPRAMRYKNFAALGNKVMEDPTIETIIVDSLTTLVDYVIDEVRVQQGRKIADGKTVFKDDAMQIQDWGAFAYILKQLIIAFKSSGKRVIFTAHVETREDESSESSKTLYRYIACPGQLRETIAGYFDEVWHITQEQKTVNGKLANVRFLNTAPSSFREAPLGLKTASSGLGIKFELDFKKLVSLVS